MERNELRAFSKGEWDPFISKTKVQVVSNKGLIEVAVKTVLEKKMVSFRRRRNSELKRGLGRKFGPVKSSPGKMAEILLD